MGESKKAMKEQWYDAKTLPPKDTSVNVMVQEVCGGILRNQYHIENTYITSNMCFKEYWSTKSGIIRYWRPINLPKGFKKITTNIYELENNKYEQD